MQSLQTVMSTLTSEIIPIALYQFHKSNGSVFFNRYPSLFHCLLVFTSANAVCYFKRMAVATISSSARKLASKIHTRLRDSSGEKQFARARDTRHCRARQCFAPFVWIIVQPTRRIRSVAVNLEIRGSDDWSVIVSMKKLSLVVPRIWFVPAFEKNSLFLNSVILLDLCIAVQQSISYSSSNIRTSLREIVIAKLYFWKLYNFL